MTKCPTQTFPVGQRFARRRVYEDSKWLLGPEGQYGWKLVSPKICLFFLVRLLLEELKAPWVVANDLGRAVGCQKACQEGLL